MSIRLRLALLFVLAMAVLILATTAATFLVVRSSLVSQAATSARTLARTAAVAESDEVALDRIAGPGNRIWLTDGSGRVVAGSYGAGEGTLGEVRGALRRAPADSASATAPRPEGGLAIVLLGGHTIHSTLGTLQRTLLLVGLAVLAAAGALGAFLAARALRPVDRMRAQVDAIPGDALERRISEGRADELGRLARAFNRLLARAERASEEQQRFVADASHELRTPVTALQGHARIVARAVERGDWPQARESADVVLGESRRLAATLAELLSLAESGADGAAHASVRLDEVVTGACDELRLVAPGRELRTTLAPAVVSGDAGRLRELVRILVDNALKYSPPETAVEVTVADGARPELVVRDHGRGLSDADRKRAFDRFFRGSAADGVTGSGLGLAIASEISRRHGAELALEPAAGGGTRASVRFPGTAAARSG